MYYSYKYIRYKLRLGLLLAFLIRSWLLYLHALNATTISGDVIKRLMTDENDNSLDKNTEYNVRSRSFILNKIDVSI